MNDASCRTSPAKNIWFRTSEVKVSDECDGALQPQETYVLSDLRETLVLRNGQSSAGSLEDQLMVSDPCVA